MSYSGGWHPHIESALCLTLSRLFEDGSVSEGCTRAGVLRWTNTRTREKVASVGYTAALGDNAGTLTLNYTHANRDGEREQVKCVICLWTRPMRFGGKRWFMSCPYTAKPALKLYKFSGIAQFCHRTAIRPLPSYASQRASGQNRIIEKRWAIRRKLGDDFSDLFCEPCKPKWMRWRTFERYAARDAALSTREMPYFARFLGLDEAEALGWKK